MGHSLRLSGNSGVEGIRAECSCGWQGETFRVGSRPEIETEIDADEWAIEEGSDHRADQN